MATAVKIQMVAHGISQSQVVQATGADPAVVSKLVNAKIRSGAMAYQAARYIAKALRGNVRDLFPWLDEAA